jgi:hypothetical protein
MERILLKAKIKFLNCVIELKDIFCTMKFTIPGSKAKILHTNLVPYQLKQTLFDSGRGKNGVPKLTDSVNAITLRIVENRPELSGAHIYLSGENMPSQQRFIAADRGKTKDWVDFGKQLVGEINATVEQWQSPQKQQSQSEKASQLQEDVWKGNAYFNHDSKTSPTVKDVQKALKRFGF